MTQNNGYYAVQVRRNRAFKVTDFGTNENPVCDFLLVINATSLSCTVSELSLSSSEIFAVECGLGASP